MSFLFPFFFVSFFFCLSLFFFFPSPSSFLFVLGSLAKYSWSRCYSKNEHYCTWSLQHRTTENYCFDAVMCDMAYHSSSHFVKAMIIFWNDRRIANANVTELPFMPLEPNQKHVINHIYTLARRRYNSSGIWRHVDWEIVADVSEELTSSICMFCAFLDCMSQKTWKLRVHEHCCENLQADNTY